MVLYHFSLVPSLVSRNLFSTIWSEYLLICTILVTGEGTIKVIHAAMKEWTDNTCIKFVPRTDETDYVRIVKKQG